MLPCNGPSVGLAPVALRAVVSLLLGFLAMLEISAVCFEAGITLSDLDTIGKIADKGAVRPGFLAFPLFELSIEVPMSRPGHPPRPGRFAFLDRVKLQRVP